MSNAIEPFNPENIPQAMTMADMLSESALIPTALRGKPADVFVVIAKGRELRLSPMQSLGLINVIEGKPVAAAELKVALCLREAAVCEYFRLVSSDATQATYETKRAGSAPVKLTWTMAQAQKAGLATKQNWMRHPDAMLRARCSSALATAVYSDLTQGLITPDEADEIREDDGAHSANQRTNAVKAAARVRVEQGPALASGEVVDHAARARVALGECKDFMAQSGGSMVDTTHLEKFLDAAGAPAPTPPKPERKMPPIKEEPDAPKEPKPSPPVTPSFGAVQKQRIADALAKHSLKGKPAEEFVKRVTGKTRQFDENDVALVEVALQVPENLPPEPPPPGDMDEPAPF